MSDKAHEFCFSIKTFVVRVQPKRGIEKRTFYDKSHFKIYIILNYFLYQAELREKRERISKLEERLACFSLNEKLQEYSNLSFELFKNKLSLKYANSKREKSKEFKFDYSDLKNQSAEFIAEYPVVLSTTWSLTNSLAKGFMYDYVIIDEASQVGLETGVLSLSCAKKAVIVGDLKQLDHIVDDENKKEYDNIFEKSELQRSFGSDRSKAYHCGKNSLLSSVSELFQEIPNTFLREHYRCHPEIIQFCNKKFYNDQLIILTDPSYERTPLVSYITAKGGHARKRISRREYDIIKEEVHREQKLDEKYGKIGIISPYADQAKLFKQDLEFITENGIEADTVHSFQGREKEVVILSTVANEATKFSDNERLLNVAVSRAIEQLIVVTNQRNVNLKSNTADLIRHIRRRNMEVVESKTYSVFDSLYNGEPGNAESKMRPFLSEILKEDRFNGYVFTMHYPLKALLRDPEQKVPDKEDQKYAGRLGTHLDFLIYNKLDYSPVLAIEVDGVKYHEDPKQVELDKRKNRILDIYELDLLRLPTNGSNEKKKIIKKLEEGIKKSTEKVNKFLNPVDPTKHTN